jgi:hypothetical protein
MKRLALFAMGTVAVLIGVACSSNSTTPAATSSSATGSQGSTAATTSTLGTGSLPGQTTADLPAFPALYDAHTDMVLVTDAFPKSAATQYHATYAPALASVKPDSQPLWFVFKGPTATGQPTVLGSEPGESDYSPLWRTVVVSWKPGVTPTVFSSDDQINEATKKGEVTETTTSEVVNATVVSVGKSSS